mmetsp:Transcript_23012/g.39536  ORF Transcript_23012/g.39536 Transcript_23012/m.39536 type:complete len:167 (+) Transcript_23012:122-622(+)
MDSLERRADENPCDIHLRKTTDQTLPDGRHVTEVMEVDITCPGDAQSIDAATAAASGLLDRPNGSSIRWKTPCQTSSKNFSCLQKQKIICGHWSARLFPGRVRIWAKKTRMRMKKTKTLISVTTAFRFRLRRRYPFTQVNDSRTCLMLPPKNRVRDNKVSKQCSGT